MQISLFKYLTLLIFTLHWSTAPAATEILDDQLESSRTLSTAHRGTCEEVEISDSFKIIPLAPEFGSGITTSEQPFIYWFLSETVEDGFFSFKLVKLQQNNEVDDEEPFIKTLTLKQDDLSSTAGIQALSLEKHDIALVENAKYKWTISLICDFISPSSNRTIGGIITYQTEASLTKAAQSDANQMADLYQQKKVGWYDAMHILSSQIETDNSLRTVRADLIEQENLPAVVAFEREAL